MIFAVEPLERCWSEIYDKPNGLAFQHWNETQGYRGQKYNPLFERYNQYAKLGWFLQFTARADGKLVGYAGVYLTPSMHSQELISVEDTWFLLPEYRVGWNAVRFYRFMEAECQKRGVVEATLTLPEDKNLDPILKRLGYTCRAKQFSKIVRADSAQPEQSEDVRAVTASCS